MPNLGPTEIIIIAVVVLVLFGAKKMPDAARSLGRSARILKSETKGLHDDDDDKQSSTQSQQASDGAQSEQSPGSAKSQAQPQPQQLSSTQDEQPVVNGKVVNRDQAQQAR